MRKVVVLALLLSVWLTGHASAASIKERPRKPLKTSPPRAIASRGTYGLGGAPAQKKGDRESVRWDGVRVKVRARRCVFAGDGTRLIIEGRMDPVFVVAEKSCSDGTTVQGQFCVQNCPGGVGRAQLVELPSAPEVLDLLVTPVPMPRFSPRLEDVRSSNLGGYLVGMRTYFAVDPLSWVPVVGSPVVRGPFQMALTAYPVGLEVSVDDDVMNCLGSGVVVTGANERTADRSCSVVFMESGVANVEVRVRYRHVYTATGFVPVPPVPVNEESFSPVLALSVPVVEVQPVIVDVD